MQLQPEGLGAWGIAVALAGGAMRGSIPYMFVSLGECLTEKSGKINLGMEGVLLMGAVTAFAVSDLTRIAVAGGACRGSSRPRARSRTCVAHAATRRQ